MTVQDVEDQVANIRAVAGDDEAAHSWEDQLRQSVLEAIANGADNPADLARAALKTSDIEFARWCA